MELVPFELRAGQLNQTYELIKNCQVVKPPHDKAGFYSAEFFLDKRNGLSSIFSDATMTFLDHIKIEDYEYYYYTKTATGVTSWYIGYYSSIAWTMTQIAWPFRLDSDSPKHVVYGKNIYGTKDSSGYISSPTAWAAWSRTFKVSGIEWYSGAYVKLLYTGTSIDAWDYILFTWSTSVLRWSLNRVEDVEKTLITASNPIASTVITVHKSTIPFFTVWQDVVIIPHPLGWTTPWQHGLVVSKNELTGEVTLDTAVTCLMNDQVKYWEHIYIIGTNDRGSLPAPGDTYDLYKKVSSKESNCVLVWHVDSAWSWTGVVSMVLFNGTFTANKIEILNTDKPIIDIANFDQNVFALTTERIYYSQSTPGDNTQFYPLDSYPIDRWFRMFKIGKALLVFWRTNKLITVATANNNIDVGYAQYDVNYSGYPYSKYSMVFSDQTVYVLQDDLQLMQVDIVVNDATSYDIVTKNILLNTRGIFENISWSVLSISSSTKYLNYVIVKDWTSTVYQFDKQYQHWLVNEYVGITINKFGEKVLTTWKIAEVGALFTDYGTEYSQEVNFTLNGWVVRMNMPYFLRTVFWMTPNIFDIKMNMEIDIGWKTLYKEYLLRNLDIDNRLSPVLSGDEIVGYDVLPAEATDYNGNNFSFQMPILKTWRYIRFKYNGLQRFCIGDSAVFIDYTKPFINEINKTI